MVRLRTFMAMFLVLGIVSLAAATRASSENVNFLSVPSGQISLPEIDCEIASYPQALPNDGISEAVISVQLSHEGQPICGETVRAQVTRGDGLLLREEVLTDDKGVASFSYRAGVMPEPGRVTIESEAHDLQAELAIPLAPVAYMDVTLVTSAEYQAYLARQASAAPIYKLEASVFPGQLAADGGSLAQIRAKLMHVDGKPAAGVPLTAKVMSGDGKLMFDEPATDSDGNFSFHFIAGFTPGTAIVQIMEPSTGLIYSLNIIVVEAGPARVELFYVDPFSVKPGREGALLPADGVTGLPMIAQVTSLTGLPLAGVELKIEILDMENGWLEIYDPLTDIEGKCEFIYHAGTFTGPVRLRAFVASGMELPGAKLSLP